MNKAEELRKIAGGAHIHTANKCCCYYEQLKNNRNLRNIDEVIDKAIAGDWRLLEIMLRHLF